MNKLPKIQLLGSPWTRAFRNVWMLEELGIPYECIDVAPFSDVVKSYVRSGKIPILLEFDNNDTYSSTNDANNSDNNNNNSNDKVHPTFVLYESSAINTYLADTYGDDGTKQFAPTYGTRERAIYDQTISCIMTELDAQGLWIHRKHTAMGHLFGSIPEAADAAKTNFGRINRQLAKQLNPYLLGEHFTAADILYVHCLDWAKSIGWTIPENIWDESIVPYRTLCHNRPAYQAAKSKRDIGKDQRRQEKNNNNNNKGEQHNSNL